MRAVVKQDVKQIAVNTGKVALHVQTCVNKHNVKKLNVGYKIKITYLKQKLITISSYFSMLKVCCDYFIVKGH